MHCKKNPVDFTVKRWQLWLLKIPVKLRVKHFLFFHGKKVLLLLILQLK